MDNEKRAVTSRDSEKYIVRFPEGMRDRLKEAAKASNRTLNAEIISRLERSFNASSDADWQLRVAEHTNEARLDALQGRLTLLRGQLQVIESELAEGSATASPAQVSQLRDGIQKVRDDIEWAEAKRAKLVEEGMRLNRARQDVDRDVLGTLDRIADGAIQDELRDLNALEEKVLGPGSFRHVAKVPADASPAQQVPVGIEAYRAMLDEALAKRDAQLREWWMKEFGYDPQGPKIERPESKGPARSGNARRRRT